MEKDHNPGVSIRSVETDPQWHRTGRREVVLKAREEITERPLAAAEQPMHVPRLRRPASVRRVERKSVALQHDDMFEVVGEGARRRQAGHPGADHDRLPADQVVAILLIPVWRSRNSLARPSRSVKCITLRGPVS